MAGTIFQIEEGEFGLKVVDKAEVGYLDSWQAPGGKTLDGTTPVSITDYETGVAWSCQVTSGAITATPNVTTVEVPATFCEPAKSVPQPSETSYNCDMSFLQDPNIVAGINRYLFENDTEEAYFYLGLNGGDPPKVIGRLRLIAGTVGGAARTTLTFDISLPLSRKPDIEFGDAAASEVVPGEGTAVAAASSTRATPKATAGASSSSKS